MFQNLPCSFSNELFMTYEDIITWQKETKTIIRIHLITFMLSMETVTNYVCILTFRFCHHPIVPILHAPQHRASLLAEKQIKHQNKTAAEK